MKKSYLYVALSVLFVALLAWYSFDFYATHPNYLASVNRIMIIPGVMFLVIVCALLPLIGIERWNQRRFAKFLGDVSVHLSAVRIFSLNPDFDGSFHGKKVVGEAVITDDQIIHALMSSLQDDLKSKSGPSCFNPHHGLRINFEGKVLDLMMCYECTTAHLYVDGKKHVGAIGYSSQKILDGLFKMNDVPIEIGIKFKQQREAAEAKLASVYKLHDDMRTGILVIMLVMGAIVFIIQKFLGH